MLYTILFILFTLRCDTRIISVAIENQLSVEKWIPARNCVIPVRRKYPGNPSHFENHPRATLRAGNERETSRTLILQRYDISRPARRMTKFALNSGFRRLRHISPQISLLRARYNDILFSSCVLFFAYFYILRVYYCRYIRIHVISSFYRVAQHFFTHFLCLLV